MNRKLNLYGAAILLLCLPAAPRGARASLITSLDVTVAPTSGGSFQYTYTLTNADGSDYSVGDFNLAVSPDADLTMIAAPAGWQDLGYLPGQGSIAWSAIDETAFIAPGAAAVFSFVSALPASLMNYQIFGYGADLQDNAREEGEILAPGVAAVPEPSGLVLLAAGLAALAGTYRRTSMR